MQLALWFWAGVSKLNHHFPAVVCVMISNSPIVQLVVGAASACTGSYPNDLRPGSLAVLMAHMGTLLELSVPIVLACGSGRHWSPP